MGIITKSKLLSYRNKSRTFSKSISDSLNEHKVSSKYNKTTIFLSHKHDEIEELDSAIELLKNYNVDIYVDWQDDGMPKYTSGITAKRIKEKIKENKKFILLATEEAIVSKWCNWELGLGDADKYIKNIALLPIKDYSEFSGVEYLKIYPYIYEGSTEGYYYVKFPNGNEMSLLSWLIS